MSERDDRGRNGQENVEKGAEKVVPFPFSRSGLARTQTPARNLGMTELSVRANPSGRGAKGHWCANCKGIWYSSLPECQCPVCGRRG